MGQTDLSSTPYQEGLHTLAEKVWLGETLSYREIPPGLDLSILGV